MFSDKTAHALIMARHNIALIQQWVENFDYQTLSTDTLRCYAMLYAFINIAEAIKDIPQQKLEHYNNAAYWRDIIGFRNHLAHTYEDSFDYRLWNVIQKDIPELKLILDTMLADLETRKS